MSAAKKIIKLLQSDINFSQKVNATYTELVDLFPLQVISSKTQHEKALKVIESLITHMNAEKLRDKGLELYLKTLSELAGSYESKFYKNTEETTGAEMLTYLMELKGLKQTDLSKELGGQSVVSKILNGERELNIRQIKSLAAKLKVPASVFI